jgi:hypothetical protein
MTIDEVTERAMIYFPEKIDGAEAETLLDYLTEKLPGKIEREITYFTLSYFDSKTDRVVKDRRSLQVSALIFQNTKDLTVAGEFRSRWEDNPSFISGVAFGRIPGKKLSDYKPGTLELWDKTRKIINDYFEKILPDLRAEESYAEE